MTKLSEQFWQRKSLSEMTPDEWEALCDGCGRCCLNKLENEDSGEVYFTNVACQLLDDECCQCRDYPQRKQLVPECIVLTPSTILQNTALPESCAYVLLAKGQPLFDWHPLISGDKDSVHHANISVRGKTVSERYIHEQQLEDHIVDWFDSSE